MASRVEVVPARAGEWGAEARWKLIHGPTEDLFATKAEALEAALKLAFVAAYLVVYDDAARQSARTYAIRSLPSEDGDDRSPASSVTADASDLHRGAVAPEELRPHIGRWIAALQQHVVAVADSPEALVSDLRNREISGATIFRVPGAATDVPSASSL